MTDHSALIERLEANEPLTICPYDRRSPEYWTTNDIDPCKFCGTKNEEGAPDLCRGADTRLFAEAAAALRDLTEWRDISTAPRQETVLVGHLGFKGWQRIAICNALGEWSYDDRPWLQQDPIDKTPTHWLPLPSAPNQAKEAD